MDPVTCIVSPSYLNNEGTYLPQCIDFNNTVLNNNNNNNNVDNKNININNTLSFRNIHINNSKINNNFIKNSYNNNNINLLIIPPPSYNNNKVINLSSFSFPPSVFKLLGKGLNFSLAPKRIPVDDIICDIECGIRGLLDSIKDTIR